MADGRDLVKQLNRCMPIAAAVALGDMLEGMCQHIATLEQQLVTLAIKLNNDAGVTDVNYVPIVLPASSSTKTFTPAATQAKLVTPPSLL
jgi:hypothetical protein